MSRRPNSYDGAFPELRSPNVNSISGRLLLSSINFPGDPPRTASPVYKYRGGGKPVIWKTVQPREVPRSPAVGTYNLARVMDEIQPSKNDYYGHSLSSSFKSSGRSKVLMNNATNYATMGSEWKSSHLGPGYYSKQDNWGCEERQSVDMISTRELRNGGVRPNISGYDDKPWRTRKKTDAKGAKISKAELGMGIGTEENLKEKQFDIDSVRNLPPYR